jgi:two-component system sensor histidine kinase VanS
LKEQAEEDLNRIWDHFYRAERSQDRKSRGTGLGLAIVKHILELHESEFGVVNTNQGVAFSFTLFESGGKPNE